MKPAQVHVAETVEAQTTDRPGNGSRVECRGESPSVEYPKSATRKRSKSKAVSSSVVRRSTGPRTLHGKQRSKYNALKHGVFSKTLLLEDESRSEYELLLNGLREHFQPQGALETLLVETLATLFWRKRRVLQAEGAEIAKVAEFAVPDELERLRFEADKHERVAESSGGMLRHSYNPFIALRAAEMLALVRTFLERFGFQDKDPWILRKLCGLDEGRWAHFGLFHIYLAFQEATVSNAKENNDPAFIDERKKHVLTLIDTEIESLKKRIADFLTTEDRRAECTIAAAVVPPQGVAERLLRYEAHLSREIDRTLSQLERLQRMRLGQAVPPLLKVELSG